MSLAIECPENILMKSDVHCSNSLCVQQTELQRVHSSSKKTEITLILVIVKSNISSVWVKRAMLSSMESLQGTSARWTKLNATALRMRRN